MKSLIDRLEESSIEVDEPHRDRLRDAANRIGYLQDRMMVVEVELEEARELLQLQFRHNTYLTREVEWLRANATTAPSAATVSPPHSGTIYESGYMPDLWE